MNGTGLIKHLEFRESVSGTKFAKFILQDKIASTESVIWGATAKMFDAKGINNGSIVEWIGVEDSYKGKMTLKITKMDAIQGNASDYMPLSGVPASQSAERIRSIIEEFVEPHKDYAKAAPVIDALISRPDVMAASASKIYHHSEAGGLLEHTASMMEIACRIGELYESIYPGSINIPELLIGCVFHDIGKVEEIKLGDYTTGGSMIGHIFIGAEMCRERLSGVLEAPAVTRVMHMILSHHGSHENGSPVVPQTTEAILLHQIDMIDSRMAMCRESLEEAVDGKSEWSKPLGCRVIQTPAVDAKEADSE